MLTNMNMNTICNLWITVNKKCNLNCKWCYSKNTSLMNKEEMSPNLGKRIIDLASELNISHVSIIGGEPTLYSGIIELVNYASLNCITPGIITNGIALSNSEFLLNLKENGLSSVNISMKGHSEAEYHNNTGYKEYNVVLKAIKNLSDLDLNYTVSTVINNENIDNLTSVIKDAIKYGAHSFYFSFEFNFDSFEYNTNDFFKFVFKSIQKFSEQYETINELTNGNFILHQTFPLCLWNKQLIDKMNQKGQLSTSCQLLQKSGLVFDTNGDLLLCNALYDYPIGNFDRDFKNKKELYNFLNSKENQRVYKSLLSYPSEKCECCDMWIRCGGGCISNWLHYNFEQLIENFETFKEQY